MNAICRFSLVAVVSILATTSYALANICDVALRQPLYNIYDSNTLRDTRVSQMDTMCQEKFRSVDDFNSKTRNFGSGGSYFAISGYLNLNSQDESQTLTKLYEFLCTSRDARAVDYLTSSTHIQSADSIIDAWKECVRNAVGLHAALHLNEEDPTRFLIHVNYRPTSPNSPIKLLGYDSKSGYSCRVNDRDVKDIVPEGEQFFISCNREVDVGVIAYINTNLLSAGGSIGPFTVPSAAYINLNKSHEQLREDFERLRSQFFQSQKEAKVWAAEELRQSGKCPDGYYATGIRQTSGSGGPHGYVESIWVYCRPLNLLADYENPPQPSKK
jgi:hypothetical protein